MGAVHYVMPMAGRGSRFAKEGFDYPKPLIDIYGKPFFFWATQSIMKFVDVESLDFVVLREHVEKYEIDKAILSYYPDARIHVLDEVTEGAVITCLKGISDINDEYPVIFNDCDHLFICEDFNELCNHKGADPIDGALLTFEADEPKFSFVRKDESGNVVETKEKEVISDEAICGCYYFKNVDIFKKNADAYLKACQYNEFFMSGVYNVMIDNGLTVRSYMTDVHVTFGVPEEYEIAKEDLSYRKLL